MPSSLNNNTVSITANGTTRYFHHDGTVAGFLTTGGGWDMYANNSGQIWAANYGWLHDCFFSAVSATSTGTVGNLPASNNCVSNVSLVDNGGTITIARTYNCNCNCNCK